MSAANDDEFARALETHKKILYKVGWRYLVANLLVGIAIIPISSWMARRSIGQRFTRHLDGRNLSAARQFLASLAAFEAEAR